MAEGVTGTQKTRWDMAPFFLVDDVVATANFHRDKLGFHYERFWGDPPRFVIVQRDGIAIMLRQLEAAGLMRPNSILAPEDSVLDAYIWVGNADALYEELQNEGVKIVRPICDQPYDCPDFDIEDCNGYRLCFGHCL
jgi:predicted enzyme related to lactoylglutathione lyase